MSLDDNKYAEDYGGHSDSLKEGDGTSKGTLKRVDPSWHRPSTILRFRVDRWPSLSAGILTPFVTERTYTIQQTWLYLVKPLVIREACRCVDRHDA